MYLPHYQVFGADGLFLGCFTAKLELPALMDVSELLDRLRVYARSGDFMADSVNLEADLIESQAPSGEIRLERTV